MTIDDAAERLVTTTAGAYESVRCPRCDSDDRRFRYRLTVASIVSCGRCGLSYVHPRLSGGELDRKLQEWAQQDVVDEERLRIAFEPATLDYFGRFLALLRRHVSPGSRRLLDVGCSTGALLSVAKQEGWDVRGLEVGGASSRYARETLGLDVRAASLYDVEDPPASYDAVAMVEVIEHLQDPKGALERIHAWLRPNGVLLVTTPNFDSLYRRLFGERWWVINCEDEHIVLFSMKDLCALLEDVGFTILETRIQNLDVLGLVREARMGAHGQSSAQKQNSAALDGYYEARSAKSRVKNALRRMGVLSLARRFMRVMDWTYSQSWSPTHAWGEQLVVVARRRS